MQACEDSVTRGGVLAHDDVTGLLAAERVAALVHVLEHVAVSDSGLSDGDPVLAHRDMQTEVAHHRRDEGVVGEVTALLHGHREDGHDLVTVDVVSLGIHREAPVGVAVVSDADVGAQTHDGLGEVVEVGRADTVVDVPAVGVCPDDGHLGAGVAERLR